MENKPGITKTREDWKPLTESSVKSRSGRPLRNRVRRHVFPERIRQKRQVLQDMAKPLKRWLIKHRDNPYPTKAEKIALALGSQMTLVQVSNWFANARRRLKNTVKTPNVDWSRRIKLYNTWVVGNAELLSISSNDSIWDSEDNYENDTTTSSEGQQPENKSKADHSYSALEAGIAAHSTSLHNSHSQLSNGYSKNATPNQQLVAEKDSGPIQYSSRSKRRRDDSDDEETFSDETLRPYDYRPKKYKRNMMQRYLYDVHQMGRKDEEELVDSAQIVPCQRTNNNNCSDSVGYCSGSDRFPSRSQSLSSIDSGNDFQFSEDKLHQELFKEKKQTLFSRERLHNGRFRKELDAAVVLASLGCTVANPSKSTVLNKNRSHSDKNLWH